jgi:hypothetical protein
MKYNDLILAHLMPFGAVHTNRAARRAFAVSPWIATAKQPSNDGIGGRSVSAYALLQR